MARPIKPNLKIVSPGIRLYTEDPQQVIKRQTRRSLLIIIIILILTAALLFVATDKIKKMAIILEQNQNLLKTNLEKNASEVLNTELANNWRQISSYETGIINALPEANDLLGYQNVLEQAAQAAAVEISVSFTSSQAKAANLPGVAQTKTASLDHNVEAKGSLINILTFLEKLENLPYFVQVNSFNITSSQGVDQTSSATLALKIYTK